jgi:hypothetical protein
VCGRAVRVGVRDGDDAAQPVVLTDPLPSAVTYVPGSLQITAGANAGPLTDASGDDQGEYTAGGAPKVTVRLGTGATSAVGGNVLPTESFAVHIKRVLMRQCRARSSGRDNNAAQRENPKAFVGKSHSKPLLVSKSEHTKKQVDDG